jgi:photosystem II stability/assembly factor-like uncharacterized protein
VAVVTAEGLHVYVDGARSESFETAPTRDEWHTPWGGPASVRSLAVAPDTGVLYVNVHVGGILRSTDEGRSWEATIDLHQDVHEVLALAGGVVLAACGNGGLALSRDGGTTWSTITAGLPGGASYARAVAVSADGQWVLLSASGGPGGARSAVYRRPLSADDTVPFVTVADGVVGNVDTGNLTAARFESESGQVFVSDDDGATWRPA